MPINHLPPYINKTDNLAGRYGVFPPELVETAETLVLRLSLQSNIIPARAMNLIQPLEH